MHPTDHACIWQDHKTKSIEYSHITCLWIVQIHCMYVHVMGIFALFLFFSQVDFAIIRLLADWLVTGFSTMWFIQVTRVHVGLMWFLTVKISEGVLSKNCILACLEVH